MVFIKSARDDDEGDKAKGKDVMPETIKSERDVARSPNFSLLLHQLHLNMKLIIVNDSENIFNASILKWHFNHSAATEIII